MRYNVIAAHSLEEALQSLRDDPSLYPVAGGTDILPRVNQGIEAHGSYLLLGGIPGLRFVSRTWTGVRIGALTTLTEIAESSLPDSFRALKEAASRAASSQIRNSGTIGGNLLQENRCMYFNQSVSWRREAGCFKLGGDRCYQYKGSADCVALFQSDTAPALMALGATVVLQSADGSREIPVESLYLPCGRNNKALEKGELLTEVRIPRLPDLCSAYVRETVRGSFDFPIVSCAAALQITEGNVTGARIVMGSAGTSPARAQKSEELLIGKTREEARELITEAAQAACRMVMPFCDSRVDGAVRRVMGAEVTEKALRQLL